MVLPTGIDSDTDAIKTATEACCYRFGSNRIIAYFSK